MLKRKIITFSVAFIFCAIIIIFTSDNKKNNDYLKENTTTSKTEYVIKDYCGKIAVFKNNEETPEKIYDVFTNTLPSQDIVMIRHGITAKNQKELNKLISDYTS